MTDDLVDGVEARCFCGGAVAIGYSQNTGDPMVTHAMPACSDFLRLGVLDYLRLRRQRVEGIYVSDDPAQA